MHFGVQPWPERINETIHLKATDVKKCLSSGCKKKQLKQLGTTGMADSFVKFDNPAAAVLLNVDFFQL